MSEALYERYKEALRRGHVASQRGRDDVALDAYGEAAELAPDRALPLVGIAGALERLGRPVDALAAYDAALERAPTDEAALRGRADLLVESGDRIDAAEALTRLAVVLDAAGRLADATRTACGALELAESRDRRDAVRDLSTRLLAADPDAAGRAVLATAERLLADPAAAPAQADADPAVDPPAGPRPVEVLEPGIALAAAERSANAGDGPATLTFALMAAVGYRAAGTPVTAIDACYLALARNPADPELHLLLAELYLDRGWSDLAGDKLALLARLADLDGDPATRLRICAIATDQLPDDERLAAICA